jgi:hypothetical protein
MLKIISGANYAILRGQYNMDDITKPREMIRDKLPYGGAVNIRGEIVWRITKEEHDTMKARVLRLFESNDCMYCPCRSSWL